jgi:signal transduction histidine kinase
MDEGIGLSPEDISRLFKPFPKIKKPGSYHGTGLGLSICNGIVELHGGKMWAESPGRGRGSTLFFTIPDNNPSK